MKWGGGGVKIVNFSFFFGEKIQTLESAWWALMKILKCESVKELSMSVKCK